MSRKRLSSSLTPPRDGRGPSLHRRYAASSLLRPPPTPGRAARLVMHSESRVGVRPQSAGPLRFLTPLLVRAAPLYPGEPRRYPPMEITSEVIARASCWLHRIWAVGRSRRSVSRPQPWVHSRCGSDRRDHGASMGRLLGTTARVATCVIGISHGDHLAD